MPLLLIQKKEAQIFKVLSHPARILRDEELVKDEKYINDTRHFFNVIRPNISQHLNFFKYLDITDFHPRGDLRNSFLKEPDRMKKLILDIRQMSDCSLI